MLGQPGEADGADELAKRLRSFAKGKRLGPPQSPFVRGERSWSRFQETGLRDDAQPTFLEDAASAGALSTVPCCDFCPIGCTAQWEPGSQTAEARKALTRPAAADASSPDTETAPNNAASSRFPVDVGHVSRKFDPPGTELNRPPRCSPERARTCCRMCPNAWPSQPRKNKRRRSDKPAAKPVKRTRQLDVPSDQPDSVDDRRLREHGRDLPWRQSPQVEERIRYTMQHQIHSTKTKEPPSRFDLGWIFEQPPLVLGA